MRATSPIRTPNSIPKCRSRWPRHLRRESVAARLLALGGFESCRGHGYLPLVGVVCCQVHVSATGLSSVQRIRTEWDLETSTMRRTSSTRVVKPRKKKNTAGQSQKDNVVDGCHSRRKAQMQPLNAGLSIYYKIDVGFSDQRY